jgi:Fe-S-cluster containining protein
MQPFFERHPLHFSCTACGKCCATAGEYYVFLCADEAENIREHLGLSKSWFRRRYLNRLEGGELVLATGEGERCIFLDSDSRCSIYTARPLQCRTYPFWPELVGSRRAWQREATRCEGIGLGGAVARQTIRKAVTACREQGC